MTPRRRLLHYIGRYKRALFQGGLCVIASVVISLSKPVILGRAVDRLGSAHDRSDVLLYALQYIGATLLGASFVFLQRRIIMMHTSWRIDYDMRTDFFAHLQTLPANYYQEQRTGDLMSRAIHDISAVRMLVGPAVSYAFSSLLMFTGALVMMARIDGGMAMIAASSTALFIASVYFFGRKIQLRSKAVQDDFGDISARLQENLAGVRAVRAFVQEATEIQTFARMNREYVGHNRSLISVVTTFHSVLRILVGFMYGGIFVIGSRNMIAGRLSIGEFVAFQFFLVRMLWPLLSLGWVISLVQHGMASMVRLNEVWASQPNALPEKEDFGVETLHGEIDIRGLTFAYSAADRPALRDIHLHAGPGETIGILGPTGSGKSTLLSLIARTFEPPAGTITIDDRPVENLSLRRLRDAIGMVPQEIFLFSDSIAENVRFGNSDATTEAVRRATKLAGLANDIAKFPNGLETMIGERGVLLSGGQKQRTALARALLRDPRILLLDDALSAVDTQTEDRILSSLREIRKDRTVVTVSHRISSVKDADQIIVLDEGRIVERGTHESLCGHGGYYARLYRMQTLEKQLEEIS